jgi:hypothetical protein
MSADNSSANSEGEPKSGVQREQSGNQADSIRISAQTAIGEAISITVGQNRVSSDSTSSRDSVTEDNRQTLGATAMSDSSSLFVLGLRDTKQVVGIPGLLINDHMSAGIATRQNANKENYLQVSGLAQSSDHEKRKIHPVQEDWLAPDATFDDQALHRIVKPEHGADEQNIRDRDKVTDQNSDINKVMRDYRTGIDHVFAGNLQVGIDMITATKAILELNNAPSSVIAELNHYLAVAYAGLDPKPGHQDKSSTVAADAVHFGISRNLPVQNIFDALTAEQMVLSDSGFHDVVPSPQPTNASVLSGIDKSIVSDSDKQARTLSAVETSDLELALDEPESPPAVKQSEAEHAGARQPTKDRQPENQNHDAASLEEQAQQEQLARDKRRRIALKILRKLPLKNLRLFRRI